jgi:hypothetical protein
MEDVSGIYVELVFLDAALNFGQGFFTFMLFGLNTRMIIMPLHNWYWTIGSFSFNYARQMYTNVFYLPKVEENHVW